MTAFMELDDVTSFLCLKGITNTRKRMPQSPIIGGSSSVQWRNVTEEAKDFKCVLSFLAHLSRRLMGELIVYQSL